MSSYDVRMTMEQRAEGLDACHAPRARLVPALAGQVEFAIAVSEDGKVADVTVRASDLGDRTLEQCVQEVIRSTVFPRPHGGEARVSWSMVLDPTEAPSDPEEWDAVKLASVIDKHQPDLRTECSLTSQQLEVIAYVNRRGRVVTAGVTTREAAEPEDLDCVVEQLRKWPMPRPQNHRVAKLSFSLAPPPESPPPTRAPRAKRGAKRRHAVTGRS